MSLSLASLSSPSVVEYVAGPLKLEEMVEKVGPTNFF